MEDVPSANKWLETKEMKRKFKRLKKILKAYKEIGGRKKGKELISIKIRRVVTLRGEDCDWAWTYEGPQCGLEKLSLFGKTS